MKAANEGQERVIRVRVLQRFARPDRIWGEPAPEVGDETLIPAGTDWITLGLCEPIDENTNNQTDTKR
jgi:hypothetical protein